MTKHKKRRNQRNHENPHLYGSNERKDNTFVRATMHGNGIVASDAGGIINGYFALDPSALTNTDWADFSSTYDEFRVMGASITVTSAQPNGNISNAFIAVAFDNDSAANPGSFSQVRQYSTSHVFPAVTTVKPTKYTWWRPTRGEETTITWADVANPSTSLGAIVIYASNLTVSTNYIAYTIDLYCEFRGRR
jgi:hypothetical protein